MDKLWELSGATVPGYAFYSYQDVRAYSVEDKHFPLEPKTTLERYAL